jgi:predicted Zn finger-like uncharacterized protein
VVIECPHCLTRFRLDENRLSASRSLLKCSRCHRVFPAPGTKAAVPRRPPAPPREEPLSFDFNDDDDWRDDALTGAMAEDSSSRREAPRGRKRAAEESPSTAPDEDDFGESAAREAAKDAEDADDDFDDTDIDDEEVVESRGGRISLRPVFVFLFLVVAGYAMLARALYANPEWALRTTGRIPLVGSDLRERALNRSVALIGVQGRYERTKEGKLVFLITGKAVNQSDASVKNIQVAARLLDGADRLIDQQVSFCGNSIRLDLVRDLTVQQLSILRGLKPPRRFGIQPGEQCPFVSVFTDAPTTVASFTTEVVGAQRHG